MKLAFLVSSLAPGKDGVGDYARDLASRCRFMGHQCALLALNDRHVDRPLQERQLARDQTLDVLRVPASSPWSDRVKVAREWLDRNSPDWVSLQFVAYGYHPKGLSGRVVAHLVPLMHGCKLHVMLHELWIGLERGAPLRRKIIGRLQRTGVLSLIERLAPLRIHTSNVAYSEALNRLGVSAPILPLFGNVPVVQNPDGNWLDEQLMTLGVPREHATSRNSTWRFGLFGSIYPTWSPEPLFEYLELAARRTRRRVVIASIGRRGAGELNWQRIAKRYGDRFYLASLGERPVGDISTFLHSVDFGVAITPWQLVAKSGTAAAMIDHGLPVIVAGEDQDFGVAERDSPAALLRRADATLPEWLSVVRRRDPHERITETAGQFLEALGTA